MTAEQHKPLYEMSTLELKGVGLGLSEKLAKLGIYTAQDLLFHLPLHYQDRTRLVPIGHLQNGQKALIQGTIQQCEMNFSGKKLLTCSISDATGLLQCRFFHFTASQKNQMAVGKLMRCFGEARFGKIHLQMVHPDYQIFDEDQIPLLPQTLNAVYPTTEGISQKRWQQLIAQILDVISHQSLEELLPQKLLKHFSFPNLEHSLKMLHLPDCEHSLYALESGQNRAQQRLIFEELMAHQVSMRRVRQNVKSHQALCCYRQSANHLSLTKQLITSLPFQLTAAQTRVVKEIRQDLMQNQPMLRLIQGDVGSGKTLVAALSALMMIEAGAQVALMAPTEILAEQHGMSFKSWFKGLNIEVAWLSGQHKGKQRTEIEESIASGQARMIVGTHALFQKSVSFLELGLVIIDEQHKFGVHQRLALKEKGNVANQVPHQLIMTATPIPRTLAMTAYADLDTSIIDELPPGRTPVQTVLVSDHRRDEVIERIRKGCQQGRQAYWVCTLIEESEALQCQAAEVACEMLSESLQGLSVGLIHGRMKADQKENIMSDFKKGDIDVLVATTVIEVGVDVPNASLMVIENPERLGLAQLHQLRGRVGRGIAESHCVLLYHMPLSLKGKQRLSVLRETSDGFKIAEKDLEIRGPGEVLGTRQTGLANFKIADIIRDQQLIPLVQEWADLLLQEQPEAAEKLVKRWLWNAEQYAQV